MSSNCDRIRRRALEHGEGSVEYAVWVRHAEHCASCRSEVYLQSLLRADSSKCSSHLPSETVAGLVQLANHRYAGGRRRYERLFRSFLSWSVRVAVFLGILYAISLVSPKVFERVDRWRMTASIQSAESSGLVPLAPGETGAKTTPAAQEFQVASGGTEGQGAPEAPAPVVASPVHVPEDFSYEPDVLPGWDVERKLQECREGILRQSLLEEDEFDLDVSFR